MITIKPKCGLGNMLNVVFSYYEYAKSLNTELNVIWNTTQQCPGHFLDYFKPVKGINFLEPCQSFRHPSGIKIDYRGYMAHPEFNPDYSHLKPLSHLQKKADKRIGILKDDYISVHIRRTDHIGLAKKHGDFTNDDQFIKFIDSFNGARNLYIATDNKKTYSQFQNKYKKLVKFNYHEQDSSRQRHTSLEDAIIDILVCVYSSHFLGSGVSSFSKIIEELRSFA